MLRKGAQAAAGRGREDEGLIVAHVLIVSSDVVGKRMAGVGIRYWHIASALMRQGLDVVLAVPGEDPVQGEGFDVVAYAQDSYSSLAPHLAGAQVVLVSGYTLAQFPALQDPGVPIIVDLWAPFVLENLAEFVGGSLESRAARYQVSVAVINQQLQAGDFFVCASERQRDFWLGMLVANNRTNPYVYAEDPTLCRLLSVVPFGLPREVPHHAHAVLRGVHPGIAERDKVILWNGGIWDWYDPVTLIRALQQVLEVRTDVKLVFLGMRHPNPVVSHTRQLDAALDLSKDLGLYDRHIFFIDWVPYEEVQNYLLETDIGAVLHFNHIETRFSFRARILSYLWAEVPILITEGSPSSDIVREKGLGQVVAYQDAAGTAEAILQMLSLPDPKAFYRSCFEQVREQFAWDNVVQPVVDFCRQPHFADDKGRAAGEALYLSEMSRLKKTIEGYENGRVMRLLKWLTQARRRVMGNGA
jgi:glycosyltransferase involved in cell wall biosynthesis